MPIYTPRAQPTSELPGIIFDEAKPDPRHSARIPVGWGVDIYDELNILGKTIPPILGHPASQYEIGNIANGKSALNWIGRQLLPVVESLASRGIGIFVLPPDELLILNPYYNPTYIE
jgi:hypothetical protein